MDETLVVLRSQEADVVWTIARSRTREWRVANRVGKVWLDTARVEDSTGVGVSTAKQLVAQTTKVLRLLES